MARMIDADALIKAINEMPVLCRDPGWVKAAVLLTIDNAPIIQPDAPRVMTLEEVKAAKGDDMYLEISTRTDDIPYITAATLDGVGIKGVTFYCSNFDFVAYNRRLYGWRCWTARPTDEQREAAAWNN